MAEGEEQGPEPSTQMPSFFLGSSCALISHVAPEGPASALSPQAQASLAVCLEGVDKFTSTQVRLSEYCLRPDAFLER